MYSAVSNAGRSRCSALLFYGPPGTAKTTLASAIAAELGWPLVTITPSDFVREGIEQTDRRAREIFDDLHKYLINSTALPERIVRRRALIERIATIISEKTNGWVFKEVQDLLYTIEREYNPDYPLERWVLGKFSPARGTFNRGRYVAFSKAGIWELGVNWISKRYIRTGRPREVSSLQSHDCASPAHTSVNYGATSTKKARHDPRCIRFSLDSFVD